MHLYLYPFWWGWQGGDTGTSDSKDPGLIYNDQLLNLCILDELYFMYQGLLTGDQGLLLDEFKTSQVELLLLTEECSGDFLRSSK
jgi:hypothetical protein